MSHETIAKQSSDQTLEVFVVNRDTDVEDPMLSLNSVDDNPAFWFYEQDLDHAIEALEEAKAELETKQ